MSNEYTTSISDRCGCCKFYRANFRSTSEGGLIALPVMWFDAKGVDERLKTGECHAGPPRFGGFFRSTPMFPGVYEKDWCGKHQKPKEPTP